MPQTFTRAALMELLSVNTEKTIANYVKKGWLRKTFDGKQYEVLDEKLQKIVSEKMRTNSENLKADSETFGNVPNYSENNEILEFIKAEREEIQQKLDIALTKIAELERETGEWKGRAEMLGRENNKLETQLTERKEKIHMLTEQSEKLVVRDKSMRIKIRILSFILALFFFAAMGVAVVFVLGITNI